MTGIWEIYISGKIGFIAFNLLKFTFQKTVEKCVRYASLHFSRCGRSVGVRSTRALKILQLTSISSEMYTQQCKQHRDTAFQYQTIINITVDAIIKMGTIEICVTNCNVHFTHFRKIMILKSRVFIEGYVTPVFLYVFE